MAYYPKWKYHPSKEGVIVQDPDEEKALGDEWYDTPADFPVEIDSGAGDGGTEPPDKAEPRRKGKK